MLLVRGFYSFELSLKRKEVLNGGHCLLTWPKVTRPTELGGLGINNLQNLGWALRMRWFWLQKMEPNPTWATIPFHASVKAFFNMAVATEIFNGKNIMFWTDSWLHDQRISTLASQLFGIVSKRHTKKMTVAEALTDMVWIWAFKDL